MLCVSWTLILPAAFAGWFFGAQASGSGSQFGLSSDRVTWSEFMQEQHQHSCGGVSKNQVVQWLGSGVRAVTAASISDDEDEDEDEDEGLPEALTVPGTSVWLPMRPLSSLVWRHGSDKQPFFPPIGCSRVNHTGRKLESYGPLSCFQRCVHRHARFLPQSVMVLQGNRCHCLSREELLIDSVPTADLSACNVPCPGEDGLCGGAGDHYSVYDLPSSVDFADEDLRDDRCFTGLYEENGHKLTISQEYCSANSTAVCLHETFNQDVAHAGWQSYRAGTEACSRVNGLFPAKTKQQQTSEQYVQSLYELFRRDDDHSGLSLQKRTFWINLELRTLYRWISHDGRKGREPLTGGSSSRRGCTALTRSTSRTFLQDMRCDTPLPYLTTCRSPGEAGSKTNAVTQEDIELATAVGVTGIVCLAIFVILAVILFVLKRSGKLRIRQKPAFNSTGEWDPVEESVVTRLNREACLADLQVRLQQTRSLQASGASRSTQRAGPSASSSSHKAVPRPVSAEYTDPKPLCNDYAEVTTLDPPGYVNVSRKQSKELGRPKERNAKVAEPGSQKQASRASVERRSSLGADPHDAAGIYSEPAEVVTGGRRDEGEADGGDSFPRPIIIGVSNNKTSAVVPFSPALPSQDLRLSRGDYEEPDAILTPVSPSNGRHPQPHLPPRLADEGTESGAYSVPQVAGNSLDVKPQRKTSSRSYTVGDECGGYSMPQFSSSFDGDRRSAEGSGQYSGCLPVSPTAAGPRREAEGDSRIPHAVGPRGDVYAKPAKEGVLVVSLKRRASTTL